MKAWYPLALEKDLPTDRPTAARLMGNAIVLWKDGEGKWRAFRDLCPHRLAPLSEGRVENGELMCRWPLHPHHAILQVQASSVHAGS